MKEALEQTLKDWREWAAPDDDTIGAVASHAISKFVELLISNLEDE